MPPTNSPAAPSPSDAASTRDSTHTSGVHQRPLTPLSYLSLPVPDLAATLHTLTADAADEANVSFLRSALEILEDDPHHHSSYHQTDARAHSDVNHQNSNDSNSSSRSGPRRDNSQPMPTASDFRQTRATSTTAATAVPTSTSAADSSDAEEVSRRQRLQHVLARLNRLHDPSAASGSSAGAYSNRTPPPHRQSLYDWAPPPPASSSLSSSHDGSGTGSAGRQQQHIADADSAHDLDQFVAELRRLQPDTRNSILRVLSQSPGQSQQQEGFRRQEQPARGGGSSSNSGGGGASSGSGNRPAALPSSVTAPSTMPSTETTEASLRRDRQRLRERRLRESDWVNLRSRAVLQRARQEGSPSATERILRYVMERERSGLSEEEERARGTGWFRPQQQQQQQATMAADWLDGQPWTSSSANSGSTTAVAGGSSGNGSGSNGSSSSISNSSNSRYPQDASPLSMQDSRLRTVYERAIYERATALQRRDVADVTATPRLPRISTPPVPSAVAGSTGLSPWTPLLENALRYLDGLRACHRYEDALSVAIDRGLATKEFFADKHDDFIMDLGEVHSSPASSWLLPGTVFDGDQHAMTSNYTLLQRASRQQAASSHSIEQINPNVLSDAGGTSIFDHPPGSTRVIPFDASRPWLTHQLPLHDSTHDHWPVRVILHAIDTEKMLLQGTMEAYDVPQHPAGISILPSGTDRPKAGRKSQPITTYLEGHIIDFSTHSFLTPGRPRRSSSTTTDNPTSQTTLSTSISFPSSVNAHTDASNWRRLPPFNTLPNDDEAARCLLSKARMHDICQQYVFMRWKERCFVHSKDDQCDEAERHSDQDRGHGLTISGFYYVSLRRSDGIVKGLYFDPTSTLYQHLDLRARMDGWPAFEFR